MPVHVFCIILDRISSIVHVNENFCNKNSFLDLLCVILMNSYDLNCF